MDKSHKAVISEDCLFFILLISYHFFRFPELTSTAFPNDVWLWLMPFVPASASSLPEPVETFIASILMLFVICYLLAHVWETRTDDTNKNPHQIKLALILGAFAIVVYIPMLHEMTLRRVFGPETHCHDGVVLVEEAIKKTLEGKNVYTENFRGTPVEDHAFANPVFWHKLGIDKYPALEHFMYPPLVVLIPLPFYVAANALIGWFDLRLILFFAYIAFIWFAYAISKTNRRKIIAVQFASLNPFLATFLIGGRNDGLPLAMFAAALYLVERRPRWAQVFLALACLTKQYMWFMIPFFGLFLIRDDGNKSFVKSAVASVKALWLFWIVFAAGMLPYFIWDPSAFLQGLIFHSDLHPIKGIGAYGFGTWVLFFGWVKSAADKFPFLLIQAIFTLPILFFCFRMQNKKNTLAQMILGGALGLSVFFYFSRYYHDSYFGVISTLLALVYCIGDSDVNAASTSS